jgi:hypothetical protein
MEEKRETKEKQKEIDVKEKLQEGYLKVIMILEVLGRPAEYVTETLTRVSEVLKQDKNVILLSTNDYNPAKVKGSKDLYSAFTEVEILVKGLSELFGVCFDYMPSSVEIIEPANVKFDLASANRVINDLASRLHKHDEITKKLTAEKQILQTQLRDALGGQLVINTGDVKVELGDSNAEKEKVE